MKASTKSNEVVQRDITFKVKPAVRHVVTYGESTIYADGTNGGAGGTLCEVNSEEAAEQIRKALELFHAPRRYVVVQRSFEVGNCIVYYAYTRPQAEQFQDVLQKHYQTDFRIYEQPLTDPREAEFHRASASGSLEYLMVRDGKVELTHVHEACHAMAAAEPRSIFHISLPEGISSEEASRMVHDIIARRNGEGQQTDPLAQVLVTCK